VSRDLLFEVGVEELPSSYVPPALAQLEGAVRTGLAELRLASGDVESHATPRRLAVLVRGVADRQEDAEEEVMGPASRVAFDGDGKPTKALLGFCQGRGVDPSAVRRVETPRGEYVAVTLKHEGRNAAEVLPPMLGAAATRLAFPKSMRWIPGSDVRFGRPVRWLTALLGDRPLDVKAFELAAHRESRGHRFLSPGPVEIRFARDYLERLDMAMVMADHRRRSQAIERDIASIAATVGGRVVHDPELVEINTFLVEWPTAFRGDFDARYLELPREVIVTALREHQRFFAVETAEGVLLPHFIAVRNGDERGLEHVRKGNQDVLVARLEDARFYWESDLRVAPAARVEQLAGVVWMEGLGSLREKAARLQSLAVWLAERLAPAAAADAGRAALLCKTDLLSEMIGSGKEYASLEGVMGGHYARRAGEPEGVARAIAEHYRPRGPGDALPGTDAGAILSLADKLDHVAGAFVGGKIPSGSEDPYGVRRAANGVVRVLIEQDRRLDLRDATMESTRILFAADPQLPHAEIVRKLGEFWRGRVAAALDERGVPYDARDAALEARTGGDAKARPGWIDPSDALRRAESLARFRGDPRFESLAILFKRVANILRAATETLPPSVDAARLVEPAERELLEALERARSATARLWEARDYDRVLPELLSMERAIHAFFDSVLVNAEDMATRLNRLRLLADVRESFVRGWDLSKVVVEGEK
jgi:glycyl-tRNA synthetase beta chain